MKKKNLVLIIFSAFIYVSLISYSKGGKILSDENGTGAKDGQGGCSCHGPQESPELNISVELDSAGFPVNHYVGGKSYTIKITGKNIANIATDVAIAANVISRAPIKAASTRPLPYS